MSVVRSSLLWVIVLSALLAGCASGGGSSSDDTQQPKDAGHLVDSRVFTVPDGTVARDSAGLQPDSAVVFQDAALLQPDSGMTMGGACVGASDCTDPSNTCCSILSMTCGPDPGVPFNLILCSP